MQNATLTANSLKIFGHRGAAGLEFENSLSAIQKAIELGVAGIEIDVWKTTDNAIVVFHDAYLDRLTSETGFIAEKDSIALKNLKLKNGAPIPILKEVIALIKPTNIPLLVEVKAENAFSETYKILKSELTFGSFMIGSFYHRQIMELKKADPKLQTTIMFEGVPVDLETYLLKVDPDYVVVSIDTQNEYLAQTVKAQNRKLLFYTVNTEAEFVIAQKLSPYGIISNFPNRFLNRNT